MIIGMDNPAGASAADVAALPAGAMAGATAADQRAFNHLLALKVGEQRASVIFVNSSRVPRVERLLLSVSGYSLLKTRNSYGSHAVRLPRIHDHSNRAAYMNHPAALDNNLIHPDERGVDLPALKRAGCDQTLTLCTSAIDATGSYSTRCTPIRIGRAHV